MAKTNLRSNLKLHFKDVCVTSIEDRGQHRSEPQQKALVRTFVLPRTVVLHGQKRICHWLLNNSSGAVCVLYISSMKRKLGSGCTRGMYLFLTPVKSRHVVVEGEHREGQEGKHDPGRRYPSQMARQEEIWGIENSVFQNAPIQRTSNFPSFTTKFNTVFGCYSLQQLALKHRP